MRRPLALVDHRERQRLGGRAPVHGRRDDAERGRDRVVGPRAERDHGGAHRAEGVHPAGTDPVGSVAADRTCSVRSTRRDVGGVHHGGLGQQRRVAAGVGERTSAPMPAVTGAAIEVPESAQRPRPGAETGRGDGVTRGRHVGLHDAERAVHAPRAEGREGVGDRRRRCP